MDESRAEQVEEEIEGATDLRPAAPGSLRASARRGGRWGIASALAQQLGSIAATMVLARQLSRADFGIVAVAYTVLALLYTLTDAGFGAGIIAREEHNERAASSAFWFAAAAGLIASGVAAAMAGFIASLLGVPEAKPYIAVASLVLFLNLTQSVVRGVAMRNMKFHVVYGADMIGVAVYVVVQITLALTTDLGAWVVVIGWLSMALTTWVVLFGGTRWRPSFVLDVRELRQDAAFNAGYLGTLLANYTSKNADNWIVGRSLGATALGLYYVAFVLPNIVRQRITWVGSQVMFPVLARINDTRRLRSAFGELSQVVSFVAFPALAGVALVAQPLVRVAFGPQWGGAVNPMRIVALAAVFDVLFAINTPVFLSRRASNLTLLSNLVRLGALVLGLALVVMIGVSLIRIAVVVLVAAMLALAVSMALMRRLIELRLLALGMQLVPVVAPTFLMAGVVIAVIQLLPEDTGAVAQLTLLTTLGAATYFGVGFLAFRATFGRLWHEARNFARGR